MCGIVGVLSGSRVAPDVVERMRDQVAHRGPDHAGLWQSAEGDVGLGHRRLSIIDLDMRSSQPMLSSDGRLVITFNGEIYNYRDIRATLERDGIGFRTESDTEVLLEAYRRWGEAALDRVNGMFAFAIWDTARRQMFCARDRAGEKPFYYALVNGAFLFASEIKGLLEWPGVPRRLDYEALIDFLTLGFVADPKSIWRDIRKLPPAHSMMVRFPAGATPDVAAPRRYWTLSFTPRAGRGSPDEIRETLLRAANRMAIADVPLGTFLSGGVDSSAVTAALSLSGHSVRSFTIGFDEAAYDERGWARQVAERYATQHVERTVEPSDMVSVLDRLAWHYDEPFNDYSSIPTYYLCREARQSITVALSGDGADELFAGYRKYQRLVRRAELRGLFPVTVASALSAVARQTLREGSHVRRTLTQYGLSAPAMLADTLCNGFPLPLLRAVARGPLADALRHYDPQRLVEQLLVAAPPAEVGLVNAMRHLDFALTLPGDMLVKVDRASMAVALEVRPVFLDRDVMELAAAIPPEHLASRHSAKLALKAGVRPWLPDALIDRRKQGFAMPLPEWLAGDTAVSAAVAGAHRSGPVRELLDVTQMTALGAAHASGSSNFTSIVNGAFVLDRSVHAMVAVAVPAAGEVAVYLDPATHHQFDNRLLDRESNPFAGDDILAPYLALQARFARHGIATRTADLLPAQPDGRRNIIVSFGTPDRLVPMAVRRYRALAARPDVVLSAFFAMECPIVEPTMFEALPELSTVFRRIYSWSDTEALLPFTRQPVRVEHFCWPQSFGAVHEQLWAQQDRKFLLMMNANKLPRLYVDELYTARLRAVEYFERFGEIDLYGRGWDRMPTRVGKTWTPYAIRRVEPPLWEMKQRLLPNPVYAAAKRAWRGPAPSKSATVAQYRFSLCFENSMLKGWMTEKLFDCFFTGTVPVYWGAPEVLDWVPAECFIDMRQFKDYADLRAFLHAVTPAQERSYREAARAYLESDRFTPFRLNTFVDIVAGVVSADTGLTL